MRLLLVGDPHFNAEPPHSRRDDFAESMFNKLKFILSTAINENSDVIFLGDFSHKTTQPTTYLVRMMRALSEFEDHNIKLYTIIGNHDVYAANPEFIDKTFLGVLFASGKLHRLSTLSGEGFFLKGYDYSLSVVRAEATPEKVLDTASTRIAVCHGFTQANQPGFEASDVIDVKSFEDAGYTHLFVGHDHREYNPLVKGALTVYRPGSLSRGTKDEHNWSRTPKILLMDTDTQEVREIEVPCEDSDEVFNVEQVAREDSDKVIKDFTKLLRTTKLDRSSIYAAIDQVCNDEEVKAECFRRLSNHGVTRG